MGKTSKIKSLLLIDKWAKSKGLARSEMMLRALGIPSPNTISHLEPITGEACNPGDPH
jgi:hypothetical protein